MQSKVIRILSIFSIMLAMSASAMAQNARPYRVYVDPDGWSIGMNVGTSDLWGDVGTNSAIDHYSNSKYFDKVSLMGGIYGRYTFHPSFAARFMVNFGSVNATDEWNYDGVKGDNLFEGDDYVQRYLRGQTAKASIAEIGAMFEYTPFRRNLRPKRAYKRGQFYVAAGISMFHYTPYSTVADGPTYVKTYDLSLEGQGFGSNYPKKSSRIQPAIPLAIGYRWDLGERLNLGIEYNYRITFFDYLDGVSGKYISEFEFKQNLSTADAELAMQIADKTIYKNNALANTPGTLRGNPGNNDAYSSFSVTLTFKVPTRSRIWWTTRKFGKL